MEYPNSTQRIFGQSEMVTIREARNVLISANLTAVPIKHVHPSLCKQTSSNLSYLFIFFSIIVQLSQVYPIFQPLLLNSHHGRSPVIATKKRRRRLVQGRHAGSRQGRRRGSEAAPEVTSIHQFKFICVLRVNLSFYLSSGIRHMRNVIMNLYDSYWCIILCTDCVLIVYWLYNSGHWDSQNMTSLGSCLEPAAAEAAATSKSTCWSMRAYQVQLMVLLFCLLKAGLVRDGLQCMVMDA